jgi:YHS domain-containing protein
MVTRMMLACVLSAGMLVISGCGQQGGPSPVVSQPEASVPDESPAVAATPEMAEVLAKADALDGQGDKIVSLCASCALGMDGSSEHPLHVGEYTMYFCTDDCKQAFSEDISKSVLGMKLPEKR